MNLDYEISLARFRIQDAIDLSASWAMLQIRLDVKSARRSIGQYFRWADRP